MRAMFAGCGKAHRRRLRKTQEGATMKRIITAAILVLGISLGISNRASAQDGGIRVTVPFDFAVGNRILPQGTYHISSDGGFLAFNNSDRKTSMFTPGVRNEGSKDGKSMLVFDNVNGQYFLRDIYSIYARTSVTFPKSRLERKTQEAPAIRNIYA